MGSAFPFKPTHLLVEVAVVVVVLLPEEPVRLLVRVQLFVLGGVLRRGDALLPDLRGVLFLLFFLLLVFVIFLVIVLVFLLVVIIVKVVGRDWDW